MHPSYFPANGHIQINGNCLACDEIERKHGRYLKKKKRKKYCSPCRRSHAVGFSNASRDSSELKGLFINIYFMPRNHLFSGHSANYRTRIKQSGGDKSAKGATFFISFRSSRKKPYALDSFPFEGPINFQ